MKRNALIMSGVFALLCWPTSATAQISANRRIDWSQAGIIGGIPNRTTICATLNPGASVAQINTAIASCSNGVVYLNAGTYNLPAGITFGSRSNVTLRGAGPDRTILVFSGDDPCGGLRADVCISGNGGAITTRNWTGGYAKGATQLTLDSAAGLAVGMLVALDQADDQVDTDQVFVACGGGVSLEACPTTRVNRSQQQFVRVAAINGNQVTISPGLYMPNWRASQQPQVWSWASTVEMDGVENLALDHSNSSETAGIAFSHAYRGWVKNVKTLTPNRSHVWLYRSARIEIRDSYFYGTKNAASQSYGVEMYQTSDDLIVNNIFQHVTSPIMMGPAAGIVSAYNFMTDMYHVSLTFMYPGLVGSHDSGTGMNLFEGNIGNGFMMDTLHGTGNLTTLFRNRITGMEPGKTNNQNAVNIWAFNRLTNVVGNVLGTSGFHTKYEDSLVAPGTSGKSDRVIYLLGFSSTSEQEPLGYDVNVITTLFRWGNFDYATTTTRWNASEVPPDNPVPADHILPVSLYLAAKPSWWGTVPWPAIGPDVAGGPEPFGNAHKTPAQRCYEGTPKVSGVLNFSADNCYLNTAPAAPKNLRVLTPP